MRKTVRGEAVPLHQKVFLLKEADVKILDDYANWNKCSISEVLDFATAQLKVNNRKEKKFEGRRYKMTFRILEKTHQVLGKMSFEKGLSMTECVRQYIRALPRG